MPISKQLPDGRWVPAEPLGWQPGVYGIAGANWEARPKDGEWVAELFVKHDRVATVTARSKLVLNVRMHLAQRRHLRSSS